MLKGMTGFAQAAKSFKESQLSIEIRSLNHRFFECIVHLPEGFGAVEELIKEEVRAKINRGRITVVLSIANPHPKVSVNYVLADSYMRALKQLNQKLKLENNLSLNQIINMEGILNLEKTHYNPEIAGVIKDLISTAVKKIASMRDKEGRVLEADVLRHAQTINREILKIKSFVKSSIAQKKDSLSEEEYGVFLKNTDVSEELTRIGYHVKNFQATLKKAISSGKELDFIAQEIQREANTISAKAQDANVSSAVILIKSAIDKIREQLQNAE